MPRRISTRTVTASVTPQDDPVPQQIETPYDSNLHLLRRHWKWAAFSQFFFTFNPLLATSDVTLIDIENDLVHSTDRGLSRIMQRLLVTLTQDRKISPDNWQNVLRRQYQRRDPDASPIGLPSRSKYLIIESSRTSTPPLVAPSDPLDQPEHENEILERAQSTSAPSLDGTADAEHSVQDEDPVSSTKAEEEDDFSVSLEVPEKQLDWLDLSMLEKLESLHTLAEWQFQNPLRIRQQMKSDDDQAAWRIEPIGYDAKRNAYWLIGDRLWIQREPPRLNLKRKRKSGGTSKTAAKEPPQPHTSKRQRTNLSSGPIEQSSRVRSTRSKAQSQPSPGTREGRAAKTRANQRLDAQARDLAEFRRQMTCSRTRTASTVTHKPTGIRVSARLRGTTVEDDEWQEVPDEWLIGSDTHKNYAKNPPSSPLPSGKKRAKIGLGSDESSISELTELSDGDEDAEGEEEEGYSKETTTVDTEAENQESEGKEVDLDPEDQHEEAKLVESGPPMTLPDDFVEWETICATLDEWESIEQPFERATHYAEKALYKVLTQTIVPMITAGLREVEKKKRMEEAVVQRKRSSRIAMKEIEKEEERAAMRKRLEEEEKMGRARRLEARQQREQAERLKRENAREQRRKERELREQQSAEIPEADSRPDTSVATVQEARGSTLLPVGQSQMSVTLNVPHFSGTGSGSRGPVGNWELDCEVCGRKGINQDNDVPLMCCGICNKWQHIVCHDKHDAMSGLPRRAWGAEEFICRQCHSKSSSSTYPVGFPSLGMNNREHSSQGIYGQPSNHPKNYPNNVYYPNSPSNARYPNDQPDLHPAAPSHAYASQPRPAGVTFAHYQPQQGGFSTSRPTYSHQDINLPQHARYTVTPHAISATGITAYPPTFHTQAMPHEQWPPSSSYPRTTNSYPVNGGVSIHSQGSQPYYNGHVHPSYSHLRGTTNPTVLGHYTGLQHVSQYQHSK